MEWIKTDKRLPTEIKKYLVMVHRPAQMRATMEIAGRYTHKPAVNDRRLDVNFLIHGLVTHWTPLPEPPKQIDMEKEKECDVCEATGYIKPKTKQYEIRKAIQGNTPRNNRGNG